MECVNHGPAELIRDVFSRGMEKIAVDRAAGGTGWAKGSAAGDHPSWILEFSATLLLPCRTPLSLSDNKSWRPVQTMTVSVGL